MKIRVALSVLAAGLFALSLSSCGNTSSKNEEDALQLAQLIAAAREGQSCPELFEHLDALDEKSPLYSTAQDEMVKVGCYMRDSERSDALPTLSEQTESEAGEDALVSEPWPGVTGERVAPSESCLAAVRAAANEDDDELADPLITATLNACTSVNEWMSAVESYPKVMSGAPPDIYTLDTACWGYEDTAVCSDAVQQGLLP